MLEELAARGLLYVDPRPAPSRPGGPSPTPPGMRVADLVIDDPPVRLEIEFKLTRLEQLARDRGTALGAGRAAGPGHHRPARGLDRDAGLARRHAGAGEALVPPPASNPATGRRR